MTYRPREPWVPEEVLVTEMTLAERIRYVRRNLVGDDGREMTQPDFQKAVGKANGHHGVGAWETRGTEPRESSRRAIADLTGGAYSPDLFSRRGAEAVVKETIGARLRSLQVEADRNRKTLEAVLFGLKEAGIAIPDPQAATRSAATAAPASQ